MKDNSLNDQQFNNKQSNGQQKLQAMGIDSWQLQSPEKLAGYSAPEIILPDQCKLLVVSADLIAPETLAWFEKVLTTLRYKDKDGAQEEAGQQSLSLEQVMLLPPDQIQHITKHQLKWIWFAGCSISSHAQNSSTLQIDNLEQINQLTSIKIDDIANDPAQRQSLWQQIQQYTIHSKETVSSNKTKPDNAN